MPEVAKMLVLTFFALSVAPAVRSEEPAQVIEPLDIGLKETAEAALLFLDVEVLDGQGRPMPGLRKQHFKVRLDFITRPTYSVDDLCPCDAATGDVDTERWDDPDRLRLVLDATRPRYVLYFDFSQLQYDGKSQALATAERWVRYVMADDDQAQVVAHSDATGLERLTAFTSDKQSLVEAIREAGRNPDYDDDFPSGIWERRERCASLPAQEFVRLQAEARARGSVAQVGADPGGGAPVGGPPGDVACYYFARKEYYRIDRSLLNLRYFLTQLDAIPQRKALLYFHQNAATFPGRLYSFSADGVGAVMLDGELADAVPDLARLKESVSGAATQSRTALFPIVTGYGEIWGVNLSADVADATGGAHNLGAADADRVLDAAGRGCGCYYRIGFRAPKRGSHVYQVKIIAAGDKLPRRYRLQYLTDDDRWMQTAEAVLASAGDARGVGVAAALLPAPDGSRWNLEVQIAVDVDTLELEPDTRGDESVGEWEAGALLVAHDEKDNWELLNASRIRRALGSDGPALVLHTREFDGLGPGEYELRAFAHDRIRDAWGSARVTVQLPDPGQPSLIGPFLMQADARFLPSDLPIRKKKRKARGPAISEAASGAVPLGAVVSAGTALWIRSWICPAGGARERLTRTLLAGDDPYESVGAIEWVADGPCVEARQRLDAGELPPGAYAYRLELAASEELTLEAQRDFRVVPAKQ